MAKRPTQQQRILRLLKERGKDGVYVYEFMTPRNMGGLGVSQYGARIMELRRRGYKIINKKPGHFVLIPDYSWVKMSERPYEMVIGADNIARRKYL